MGLKLLEIVVQNGTNLHNVHNTHGLRTYPVVFIGDKGGEIYCISEEQKPVDRNGGSNPVWNVYDEFNIDTDEALQEKLYLFIRVRSLRKIGSGSKTVVEFSVAIEDLLSEFGDAVDKKSVILSARNDKGEARGSVTFKYKFGPQPADPALPQPADRHRPADPPLPQPANGRRNYNGLFKAVVGGVVSGAFTTVVKFLSDNN